MLESHAMVVFGQVAGEGESGSVQSAAQLAVGQQGQGQSEVKSTIVMTCCEGSAVLTTDYCLRYMFLF